MKLANTFFLTETKKFIANCNFITLFYSFKRSQQYVFNTRSVQSLGYACSGSEFPTKWKVYQRKLLSNWNHFWCTKEKFQFLTQIKKSDVESSNELDAVKWVESGKWLPTCTCKWKIQNTNGSCSNAMLIAWSIRHLQFGKVYSERILLLNRFY